MGTLKLIHNHTVSYLTFETGDTILNVLRKKGVAFRASCGGNGRCNGCMVDVNGVQKKSCETPAFDGMTVTLLPDTLHTEVQTGFSDKLKSISPDESGSFDNSSAKGTASPSVPAPSSDTNHIGLAIDIGTTTIALSAVSLSSSKSDTIPASYGFLNPTVSYGSDVLSRIEAANAGHLKEISTLLRRTLSTEITQLLSRISSPPPKLGKICIAANTTMCHLLLGLSCKTLGAAPFRPVMLSYPKQNARKLFGSDFSADTEVFLLPGLSAFIGGDITAGLFTLPKTNNSTSLLVDLGTNGEMVLMTPERIFAASAAAGPAFEGSRIPGSEVLCALDEMKKRKALDTTGLLQGLFFRTGYEYHGHLFSQEDIRDVQTAKASVRAGIETLLRTAGLSAEDVSQIYLCGGFGTHTDTARAVAVGMFPDAFLGKVHALGNTALAGALRCLRAPCNEYFHTLQERTEIVSLALSEFYKEAYIRYMNF